MMTARVAGRTEVTISGQLVTNRSRSGLSPLAAGATGSDASGSWEAAAGAASAGSA
jgi:hypothetical protein